MTIHVQLMMVLVFLPEQCSCWGRTHALPPRWRRVVGRGGMLRRFAGTLVALSCRAFGLEHGALL